MPQATLLSVIALRWQHRRLAKAMARRMDELEQEMAQDQARGRRRRGDGPGDYGEPIDGVKYSLEWRQKSTDD